MPQRTDVIDLKASDLHSFDPVAGHQRAFAGAFGPSLTEQAVGREVTPDRGIGRDIRKVRWGSTGRGKRGGVRVIYFNRLANGEIWLLLVYGKSVRENIPAHVLRQIKEEIENA